MHAVHSAHGYCVVCGIEGRNGRDFVCEFCGDPRGTTVVCGRCRERRDATPEAIELISGYARLNIPRRPGVVIKLSCCHECIRPGEPITTTVFTLRAPSN